MNGFAKRFSECLNKVACADLLTRKSQVVLVIEHVICRKAHFIRRI